MEEVTQNLEGGKDSRRWLVVETPEPDDVMVACCRLDVSRAVGATEAAAVFDVLAVESRFRNNGAGGYLLKRCETIARGMGCRTATLSVGHWQSSLLRWARRRGYEERGGEVWPEGRRGEVPEEVGREVRELVEG